MNTIDEIQRAIERLPRYERATLAWWLREIEERNDRVSEPALAYKVEPDPALEPEHRRFSVEEYLQLETHSDVRHEYINGVIYAMSGVSEAHNLICTNLAAALHGHLRGGPCRAYLSDFKLRLQINAEDIFYYPDVMVACTREGVEKYYHRNPKLVVEVLSPATAATDRREKMLNYTQIPSVEEYVLVSQHSAELAIHRRSDNWAARWVSELDAMAEFTSIGLLLPLTQIYEQVLADTPR